MTSEIARHVCFPEPSLAFHPERSADRDVHALRGLLRYGPYSAGLVPDPIRVATIAPHVGADALYDFMKDLREPAKPLERHAYLPEWPGFKNVFGVRMVGAAKDCHIKLAAELEGKIDASGTPHIVLAEALGRALQQLDTRRSEYDVIFIYLPNRWMVAFTGNQPEDFDLHDYLKAITAAKRVPLQLIREDKAMAYQCKASVRWRVGLAIYAKAGGVPWKLADMEPDTAYIGLSYAVRPNASHGPRFVTCCSQVFDSDGSGLEFIAYDAHEVRVQRENPFLSQTEMFRVMTRSLDLYCRRHSGRNPKRVMVHKTTEFKREESDGCMEAFHLCESVDLLQLVDDVSWRGVKIERSGDSNKGKPASYPVNRGTLVGVGPYEALLWTHGGVDGVATQGAYFQGARSTPRPIRLRRHAGHGSWDDSARAILALTKMDWNNDSLYDPLPVTVSYAKVLARIMKRIDSLGTTPYQFRFFM